MSSGDVQLKRRGSSLSVNVVAAIIAILFSVTLFAAMFLSDLEAVTQYYIGFFLFLAIVLFIWVEPRLAGRNVSYPLRIISVIWFVTYAFGPIRWLNESNPYAVVCVYAGALALLALCSGYLIGPQLTRRPRPLEFITVRQVRVRRWLVIVGLASLLATATFVVVGGAPAFHPNVLEYRFEVRQRVSSYVVFLLRANQIPLYFFFAFYVMGAITQNGRNRLWLFLAILYVLFVNFLPGWRNPLMLIMLNLILIYSYSGKPIGSFRVGLTSVGGTLAVLYYGFSRLEKLAETTFVPAMVYFQGLADTRWGIMYLWASNQFSVYSYGFIQSLTIFPERVNFLGGGVIVTTLATMLPGKQELLDEKLKVWSGLNFEGGGLNLSILGESYADFGYFGLLFYPFIYGAIIGILMRNLEAQRTPARVVVAAFATASASLGSLTGLLSISSFWVLGGALVFVASREIRRPNPS